MIKIAKVGVFFTLICGLCVLFGSYQSKHISKLFADKRINCQIQKEIVTGQNREFNFAICMRGSKDVKKYYSDIVIPELTRESNFNNLINVNNNFDKCKNYLTLILPIVAIVMYNTKLLKNDVDGIKSRILFLETMLFSVFWHYSYSVIISPVFRSIVEVNISGHVILLPIIVSQIYMILLTSKPNIVLTFITMILIVGFIIHIGFTCLYFHSFDDIIYGMYVSAMYYVIVLCKISKILGYITENKNTVDRFSESYMSLVLPCVIFVAWIGYQMNYHII
jgi:hypothetical protein